MLRHKNKVIYQCLKLDPLDSFSILSGLMTEEVIVAKSVSTRAKN